MITKEERTSITTMIAMADVFLQEHRHDHFVQLLKFKMDKVRNHLVEILNEADRFQRLREESAQRDASLKDQSRKAIERQAS